MSHTRLVVSDFFGHDFFLLGLAKVALVSEPSSSRTLLVESDAPGIVCLCVCVCVCVRVFVCVCAYSGVYVCTV